MKKTESRLFSQMIIFFFIVILCFGLLIIKEKSSEIKIKRINKKIDEYVDINYKDLKNEFKISKLNYDNNIYYKKISNNKNKDLNFIITYKNNSITSNYKTDYLEGKSLFTTLEIRMQKKLADLSKNNNYKNMNIIYHIKLNNCTENIKNKLLNNDYDLPLYTITDKKVINLDETTIQKEIENLHNYVKSLKLNPKDYKLTYTDQKNETKSISIEFNEELLINNINIGKLIMENNEQELNKYNVKVNRLN